MGLLDDILGTVLGGPSGQAAGGRAQASGRGGAGNVLAALLPIVLGMLANRPGAPAASAGSGGGGLGGILGGLLGAGPQAGGGGLGQILEQFQRAGHGQEAASWVSTGQNRPISPEAIGEVFGGDTLSRIARQASLSEEETATGLSELLPEVIDRVTPDGQVPDLDQLTASVDALRQRVGG